MSLFTNDGARPMGKGEQCPAGSVTGRPPAKRPKQTSHGARTSIHST